MPLGGVPVSNVQPAADAQNRMICIPQASPPRGWTTKYSIRSFGRLESAHPRVTVLGDPGPAVRC